MSSYAHKPRRKRRADDLPVAAYGGSVVSTAEDGTKTPTFPLVSFLWPAKGNVSQWIVLPMILIIVGLFRWTTSLWPYSGTPSPRCRWPRC